MTKWQRGVYAHVFVWIQRHCGCETDCPWRTVGSVRPFDLHTMLSSKGDTWMLKDKRSGNKMRGEEKMRVFEREVVRKGQREREMVEEERSWPWTYAASLCQAPLAQETHAYAALLLPLPLQPSPTPTPWHCLVKQSWRDESGKRRGLPSLPSA